MGLEEHELREWVRRVAYGEASRRRFIRTMLELGLSGPLLAEMLATYTPAAAQGTPGVQPTFTPTRRGGGGEAAPAVLTGAHDPQPEYLASATVASLWCRSGQITAPDYRLRGLR